MLYVKQDFGYKDVNNYCFKCKSKQVFTYCDNCGKYFCTGHAELDYDYDELRDKSIQYYVHKACS